MTDRLTRTPASNKPPDEQFQLAFTKKGIKNRPFLHFIHPRSIPCLTEGPPRKSTLFHLDPWGSTFGFECYSPQRESRTLELFGRWWIIDITTNNTLVCLSGGGTEALFHHFGIRTQHHDNACPRWKGQNGQNFQRDLSSPLLTGASNFFFFFFWLYRSFFRSRKWKHKPS